MNNRKTTRGRKRYTQIIETVEEVPCPIFGHRHNSVPNVGSNVSTHYYTDSTRTTTKPYTVRRVVKRHHVIHQRF